MSATRPAESNLSLSNNDTGSIGIALFAIFSMLSYGVTSMSLSISLCVARYVATPLPRLRPMMEISV